MTRLTKSMAAPRTTSLKLKLRTTGEEVDTEVKLLAPTQLIEVFRKAGVKTASELQHLDQFKIMGLTEDVCARALSVTERWTVEDLRNAFDVQELVKIFMAVVQSIPDGPAGAPASSSPTREKNRGPYH